VATSCSIFREDLAFDCQTAPLIIVEQDAFFAKLLFEDLVFCAQVLDSILLPVIDPAGQNQKQQMPGL
jgi:hypothetical protein